MLHTYEAVESSEDGHTLGSHVAAEQKLHEDSDDRGAGDDVTRGMRPLHLKSFEHWI